MKLDITTAKGFWAIAGMLVSIPALADTTGGMVGTAPWSAAFAVGMGMALAVVAAATAQGKIAASYMDGVSRNPGAQKSMGTQLILSLVFVETLVLFTFAIVYLLMDKI